MCASAYCVLPLQGNFEGLANPGRLHGGVSVPSIAPGSRPHRTSQETEMDLTWQELMAITELQEFEASDETNTYYPIEPTVGAAGFGVTQPPTEPLLPGCGITSTYEGPYNEALHTCQHLGTNPQALYGRSGAQLPARLHPNQHSLQSLPLMNILEHTGLTGASEGTSTDSVGNAQGCPMTQLGPVPRKQATPDDLESDSGLSLGSSPPLTSPGNMATGVTAYQALEVGQCYGDGEPSEMGNMPESCRVRADLFYPMDYQHSINTYSATPSTYFPPPANLSLIHQQQRPQQPALLKPHVLPPHLHDLHLNGSAMPVNKAGSFQDTYGKPKGPGTQVGSVRGSAPLSRDERRALVLKIPFPLDKIVNLPVDDFNELLTQHTLSDAQLTLVRDIRRRGKNKVAAQNCRKRKLENIVHLEGELGQLQAQRDHLVREGAEFHHELALARQHLSDLYTEVFSQLRDEEGQPYSLDHYSLHQGNDGSIFLVSRNAAENRE